MDPMDKPIIDGNGTHPVLLANYHKKHPAEVLIKNIQIRNGQGQATHDHGGGGIGLMFVDSSFKLEQIDFLNNTSPSGGVLAIVAANPTILNCLFENNRGPQEGNSGGGAMFLTDMVEEFHLKNVTAIEDNTANNIANDIYISARGTKAEAIKQDIINNNNLSVKFSQAH
jgi:hypothetical protein